MIALVQLASIVSNGNKTENKYASYIVNIEDGNFDIVETQKYLCKS